MQRVPLRLQGRKPSKLDFEPQTLGQHIMRRRLVLGLTQKQLGAKLGVTNDTVRNWERGRAQPLVTQMRGILEFLGHDPSPRPQSLPERLCALRRALGWSIRTAAAAVGADPFTWFGWEHGKPIRSPQHRTAVARLCKKVGL